MNPYYTDYSEFLSRLFPGKKVQKLGVNLALGCPNRDGTLATGGCSYCDNTTFSQAYMHAPESIEAQLEAGRRFFAGKYPQMQYMAYFQTYTSTYAGIDFLVDAYLRALQVEGVTGLCISTRPDCLPDKLIERLADIARRVPVIVELGVESWHPRTLEAVGRHHSREDSRSAILRAHEAGLHVGVHLIAGLPGEDDDDVVATVRSVVELPVDVIKLHHLQVIKGTRLAAQLDAGEVTVKYYTPDSYAEMCVRLIREIPRKIAIERFVAQAPEGRVISPRWGLKNYQFVNLLHRRLANTRLPK